MNKNCLLKKSGKCCNHKIIKLTPKNQKDSDDFNQFLSLYVEHQNQFQESFNIITTISMGTVAVIALLFTTKLKYPILFIIITAIICITFILEIIGLFKFKRKIEDEQQALLSMLKAKNNEQARTFLSMPNRIINNSFIALIFIVILLISSIVYVLILYFK